MSAIFRRGDHASGSARKARAKIPPQPPKAVTASAVRADMEHRTPPWRTDPDYQPAPVWTPGNGVTEDATPRPGRGRQVILLKIRGGSSALRLHRIPAPVPPPRPGPVITPEFPAARPHSADYRDLPLFRSAVRTGCAQGWRGLGMRGMGRTA